MLSHVWFFVTPWTVARQAPPYMGFSRQEYRSGALLKGIFQTQQLNPDLLQCRQILYHLSHQGNSLKNRRKILKKKKKEEEEKDHYRVSVPWENWELYTLKCFSCSHNPHPGAHTVGALHVRIEFCRTSVGLKTQFFIDFPCCSMHNLESRLGSLNFHNLTFAEMAF